MKTVNVIIDEIKKMDVKSEEFFEIYKAVSDKYWTFENPDECQQCGKLLMEIAHKATEEQVILTARIAAEVWRLLNEKKTSAKMMLNFTDGREFRIDMYQDGIELEKLETLLEGSAKAIESGNFTVNGKKSKFGKDYFKKKKG